MDSGCEYLGAVRIKDGLFLGDALSAWDVDFLTSNGVEVVINCTASEFDYQLPQLSVLRLDWIEDGDVWLLASDGSAAAALDNKVQALVDALQAAEDNGVSCLVHSRRGRSRAGLAVCLYLMIRHHWTVQKALEFVLSRRPDLQLRRQYILQLLHLEKNLRSVYSLSSDWDTPDDDGAAAGLDSEETLLRNTFKNTLRVAAEAGPGARPGARPGAEPEAGGGARPGARSGARLCVRWRDVDDASAAAPTPRARSDANMHWVVPVRAPHEADFLLSRKSAKALTVEIPLTIHPALRAARSLVSGAADDLFFSLQPAALPPRIPRLRVAQ